MTMLSHGSPTRSEITFESEPPTPAAFLPALDSNDDAPVHAHDQAHSHGHDGAANGDDGHFTFPSPPARADSAGAELDTSAGAAQPAGTIALKEVGERLGALVAGEGGEDEIAVSSGAAVDEVEAEEEASTKATTQPRHPPWPAAKQRSGDIADDEDMPAPPTPTKDEVRPMASPAVPEKDVFTASPRISSPLQSSSSWSPTLGSGPGPAFAAGSRPSPSPSASASLSRQAAISRATSLNLGGGPDSPSRALNGAYTTPRPAPPQRSASTSSYDAEPPAVATTPRSARAFNRKRMSLGYISSPTNSVGSPTLAMSAAGAAGAAPSPTTPSTGSATRATFLRSGAPRASALANGSPAAMRYPERIHHQSSGSDGASAAAAMSTPREEEVNPFFAAGSPNDGRRGSTSKAPREDGQTVMDLSKNLLAEIARRERRVGELKDELKREEGELKSLRSRWQDSVLRDLAAENGPTSPTLARLRAPRKKPGGANAHDPASSAQGSTSTTASEAFAGERAHANGSAVNGANKRWSTSSSSTTGGDAPVPPVPAGVAEAFRGFSAKLPAGLGSQLNAFMDNLNVATGANGPEGAMNGTGTLPRSQGGLDVLREETEGLSDAGSDAGGTSSRDTAHAPLRTVPPSEQGSGSSLGHRASASNSTAHSTPPTSTSPTNTGSSTRTHRSTGSKRSSSLFGSFTSFKEHIEESLRAAQQSAAAGAEAGAEGEGAGAGAEGEKAFGADGLPASVLESPQRAKHRGLGTHRSTESQSSDTAGLLSDATVKQASGGDAPGAKSAAGATPAAGGWSQWSKKLKDAAVRAEKALGDAMTGESAGTSGGPSSEEQRRGSDAALSQLPQQQQRLSPSPHAGAGAGAMRRTSSNTSSSSGNGTGNGTGNGQGGRRSFNFDEDNAREKSAIAELELGWLSNLVGSGSGSAAEKRKSRAPVSPTPVPVPQADESKPRSLSPRTLLALAESDGLAPEPGVGGGGGGRAPAPARGLRPDTRPAPLGRLNSSGSGSGGSGGGGGSPAPAAAAATPAPNRRQSLALNFGGMNWGFNSSSSPSSGAPAPGSDSLSPHSPNGVGTPTTQPQPQPQSSRRNSTAPLQPGNFFASLSNAWGAEKLSAQAQAPPAHRGSISSSSASGSAGGARSRSRSPAVPSPSPRASHLEGGAKPASPIPSPSPKANANAAAEMSPVGLGLSTPTPDVEIAPPAAVAAQQAGAVPEAQLV